MDRITNLQHKHRKPQVVLLAATKPFLPRTVYTRRASTRLVLKAYIHVGAMKAPAILTV